MVPINFKIPKCMHKFFGWKAMSLLWAYICILSCEPAIEKKFDCPDKRIRNTETGSDYFKYVYDLDGNLTEKKLGLKTLQTISYNAGTIDYNYSDIRAKLVLDNTLLPDRELVISGVFQNDNIGGTIGQPVIRSYTYNSSGNLIALTETQGNFTVKSAYNWVGGNLTSEVKTRSTGNPTQITITYTYYSNIYNSTSNDFQGLHYFGKQSYNALKTATESVKGQSVQTTTFIYNVDLCGCITATIAQIGKTEIKTEYMYEKTE